MKNLMNISSGTDKVDVLCFLSDLDGGGAQKSAVNLINQLSANGWSVEILLLRSGGPYLSDIHPEVRLHVIERRRLRHALIPLVRYLKVVKPGAVLSFLTHTNLLALLAAKLAGSQGRVVVSEHNTFSQRRPVSWFTRTLIRWLYPSADTIAAVSSDVGEDLKKDFGLSRAKVRIFFNPCDLEAVNRLASAETSHPWLKSDQANPVLLAVGRLEPQKDHETLIRAVHRTKENGLPVRLLILGEGSLRPILESLVERLNLKEEVGFVGFASNPYAYMSRANVFVLSSIHEGLPVVAIEAGYLGIPMVCTEFKGGIEVLKRIGLNMRTVPVKDIRALADALASAILDPKQRPPAQLEELFSLEAAVKPYEEALGLQPGSRH